MNVPLSQALRDPTPLAAAALVLGGLVGSLVGPDWLILLTGLGMFGPFVLRESGMLSWRDEFQRETTLRAGMHALLAVGVLVTATMATQGFGGINLPMDSIRASTVLLVLGLTWILSKVLQFWGAQCGAFRLLTAYVCVAVVTWVGGLAMIGFHRRNDLSPTFETLAWVALLIWIGALAVASRRWPRTIGWILLATVVAVLPLVRDLVGYLGSPTQGWTKPLNLVSVATIPLLVTGLALITQRGVAGED